MIVCYYTCNNTSINPNEATLFYKCNISPILLYCSILTTFEKIKTHL